MAKTKAKAPEPKPAEDKAQDAASKAPSKDQLPVPTKAKDSPDPVVWTWTSGDYMETPAGDAQVSGLKITVTAWPTADGVTLPPMLTITDFSGDGDALRLVYEGIEPMDDWVTFQTIAGEDNEVEMSLKGDLRLIRGTGGLFLQARISWGTEIRHRAIGYLLGLTGIQKIVPAAS